MLQLLNNASVTEYCWKSKHTNDLIIVKVNVMTQFTLEKATMAQRGSRGIALLFFHPGAKLEWVVNVTPRPLYPPQGKTRYPLYRRLDGSQGWSGRVRQISPPPGFDPRTAQPVASRYTD